MLPILIANLNWLVHVLMIMQKKKKNIVPSLN